jgi:hypothetical protein
MRRAGKVDANQAAVVKRLRDCAVKVEILSDVGKGVPELLAGFRGVNVLLELKDGDKAPSAQKLTADQVAWHASWPGQVDVVSDFDEAWAVIEREARKAGRI